MPFGVSSGIPNVIIHAKFHVDRLRGFWAAGPPKVPFPILIGTTLTTVRPALPCRLWWCSYNFAAQSFRIKKFCSRLLMTEFEFYWQKLQNRVLCHPLGDLGVTYTVHLWLVCKHVIDVLLVLIELSLPNTMSGYWSQSLCSKGFGKTVWSMFERIRSSYNNALYKSTYTLLYFTLRFQDWSGIQVSRAYTRSHFFLTFCSL